MDADVIVVGSGMLGGLAANLLASKGKSVMILEAGPRVDRATLLEKFRNEPNKNDQNAFYPEMAWAPKSSGGQYSDKYIENVGPVHWVPAFIKLVGGTTWHWTGAFWRYIPNDFKLKSVYGWGRDWPITYQDLEPWYTRVEQITGCSGNDTDDQSGRGGKSFPPRSAPYPLPQEKWSTYSQAVAERMSRIGFKFIDEPHLRASQAFDGRPACMGNNNCNPLCPIGALYSGDRIIAKAEKSGAKLLPETVAYKLEKGPGEKIVAVHTMDPHGRTTRRTARYFILAAHGIETPKLMLMSEVGNSSDQVGRNLMSHPSMFWQGLAKDEFWPGRGPVQQGAVNDRRDGPHRAHYSAIRYGSNQKGANLAMTERLLKQGIIGQELDDRIRHDSARYMSITAGMEQLPVSTNRVMLGSRKDALGLPNPRISFDMDEYSRNAMPTVLHDFEQFDKIFEIETPLGNRASMGFATAHIMGTTIMGEDPKTSVVDGDCRCHDHSNLFIASTGVFPTSSCVNPTLTGAALSLRSADVISREV